MNKVIFFCAILMLVSSGIAKAGVVINGVEISDSGKIIYLDKTEQGTATQKGDAGPQGPEGPQGPKGDPGPVDKAAICQIYADDNLPAPPFCGKKIIFVTSEAFNGILTEGDGGLEGADAKCQRAATAAGLSGSFKAWLSDYSTSAKDRLTHSPAPYVRTDGTIIALHWLDLIDGWLKDPIICDEYNVCSPEPAKVWTYTSRVGASKSTNYYCVFWTTSNSSYAGNTGSNGEIDSRWTENIDGFGGENSGCQIPNKLYCIQQ